MNECKMSPPKVIRVGNTSNEKKPLKNLKTNIQR